MHIDMVAGCTVTLWRSVVQAPRTSQTPSGPVRAMPLGQASAVVPLVTLPPSGGCRNPAGSSSVNDCLGSSGAPIAAAVSGLSVSFSYLPLPVW